MKNYTTVLFDLDNTLLNFDEDERTALVKTFKENNIKPSEKLINRYSQINASLWKKFEKGEITKDDIKNTRFKLLIEELSIDCAKTPRQINDCYAEHLSEGGVLFENAIELCQKIISSGKQIYIVTNGIETTQQKRMRKSGLDTVCDGVFISETIGFQKPMAEYFNYVFEHIKEKDKSKIILIGDSLSSDITGALRSGIDCVWLNRKGEKCELLTMPTYEIKSLSEIEKILF